MSSRSKLRKPRHQINFSNGREQRTTMTKSELNAFRRTLERQQTELGEGNRRREGIAIESAADELDRIQNAGNLDEALRNLERNTVKLRQVQSALRRIDAGSFGVCAGCEEDINPKRLAAVPWASFCIVCQEAADRAAKDPENQIDDSLELAA
jgi:DnaK suppressor protein